MLLKSLRTFVIFAAVLALYPAVAGAQSAIAGQVRDNSGAVLPGADESLLAPFIRPAFARLRPRLVQPFKAVPLSRDGRLPGASRRRGYEPRPQAPHPLPLSERLMTTPSSGWDGNRHIVI